MENETASVLFVDDDEGFLRQTSRSVSRCSSSFVCHTANGAEEALCKVRQLRPEVIVVDLSVDASRGPESGLELVNKFFEFDDCIRILILTGSNDTKWGIRSINAGVASFLNKPVESTRLAALIEDGIQVSRLLREHKESETDAHSAIAAIGLTTRSEKMKQVIDDIAFAASTPQPVLLCGETGVGKGVVAQAIHRASVRRNSPFVRLQPSFGSHDLIASELFGHVRGSFTGANENRVGLIQEADGGTLFLDEIDTLPQQTQVALLHVLQEKEFQKIGSNKSYQSNFRLICASNTPFEFLHDGSKLRMDFYHRIAHALIHIPPLRERRADIPDLAKEFITKLSAEDDAGTVYGINNEACTWLAAQSWPGNVRELLAAVERGYAQASFHGRRLIRLSDFQTPAPPETTSGSATLSETLRNYELVIASSMFTKKGQNYSATAKALGIDRKRLKRILSRTECGL